MDPRLGPNPYLMVLALSPAGTRWVLLTVMPIISTGMRKEVEKGGDYEGGGKSSWQWWG